MATLRVGDLVLRPLSTGTRWVVTLGDSIDAVVGDVYTVVEPQERWRGWFVALRPPEDFSWLVGLSDDERAAVDEIDLTGRMDRAAREPDVAGWGRSVEEAAAHLQSNR